MENQFVEPVIGDVLPEVLNPNDFVPSSQGELERVGDGLYNTILPDGQVATVADDGTIVNVG